MDLDALWRPGPPGLHVAGLDAGDRQVLQEAATERFDAPAIRVLRGTKATTVPGLFDEAAAALQFPAYFGENWDAFDDCVTDLGWLPADLYLLLVTQAGAFLSAAPDDDLRIAAEILGDANRRWASPGGRRAHTHRPTPFHVVFDDVPAGTIHLGERLAALGVEVPPLE